MKHVVQFSICFLLGVGVGWYFGYSRPVVTQQQRLLTEYEWVRDNIDLTDTELAETIKKLPKDFEEQFSESIEKEFKLMALVGLDTFRVLERGDTNEAKSRMAMYVGGYYRLYGEEGGDSELLAKIEEAALDYPAIAAEISRKN